MNEIFLKTTTIVEGTHITPEIVMTTGIEDYGDYVFMFNQGRVEFLGIVRYTQKVYLEGHYDGLKQTVKIELNAETISKVLDDFHKLGVILYSDKATQRLLTVNFLSNLID